MQLIPVIELLKEKKLVGQRLRMSFADDQTFQLWRNFMTERKKIVNTVHSDLFCVQVFDTPLTSKEFKNETVFEKWAATEVSDFNSIPATMEAFVLPGGLYAVFNHKGGTSTGAATFKYILDTWLPASNYEYDNRPQFEVLGDKYKNGDAGSEEEVWIPIKPKAIIGT